MHPRDLSRCVVGILALALVASSAAEGTGTPEAPIGPQRRVFIDLVVEGSDGQLVSSLTREDFDVYDNGRLMQLVDFKPGAPRPRPPAAGQQSSSDSDTGQFRRFVLFVDLLNSNGASIESAKPELMRFVRDLMDPRDEMLIAVVTADSRLVVTQEFTRSRAALTAALAKLEGRPVLDGATSPTVDKQAAARELHAGKSFFLDGLASLVEHLDRVGTPDERKIVLFLSPDLYLAPRDAEPVFLRAESTNHRLSRSRVTLYGLSTSTIGGKRDPAAVAFPPTELETSESDRAARLRDHGSYTKTPGGQPKGEVAQPGSLSDMTSRWYSDAERRSNRRPRARWRRTEPKKVALLERLAHRFGGSCNLELSQLADSLRRIDEETRLGYQLAYERPRDSVYHSILVYCDRQDVWLRCRTGYRD